MLKSLIDGLRWDLLLIACLTVGLAPFFPPHLYEKLRMLVRGELIRTIDWFDLVMHGAPWALLIVKAVRTIARR